MHFPFIHVLLCFLHMPPNSILAERRDTGWILSRSLVRVLSSITGPFFCLITFHNAFFLFCFGFFFWFSSEGSPHILHFVQPNLPVWLRARQIRGNLMKGRAMVGILFIVTPFAQGRLVSASAPGLSGRPVDDDKWQTHDHEHESQCGEAGGLQEGREREQRIKYKIIQITEINSEQGRTIYHFSRGIAM